MSVPAWGRGVPGSILVRSVICCGLEQVTFQKLNMYKCIICSQLVAIKSSTELMLIINKDYYYHTKVSGVCLQDHWFSVVVF